MDKDGKVSWAEWQGIMFHEDLQVPEYRDGHELDDVVDPLGDDDIDPEELELIKTRFVKVKPFRRSFPCVSFCFCMSLSVPIYVSLSVLLSLH